MTMQIDARPLADGEFRDVPYVDPSEVDALMGDISIDEARGYVRPMKRRITDYIMLYHPDPDNSWSVYMVPMTPGERQKRIQNLLQETKVVNGKRVRWNFAKPQVEERELPIRCFVAGCLRAGGFSSRHTLIGHIYGKHPNEVPMYQAIIERLLQQTHRDIPEEQWKLLGIDPEEIGRADEMAPKKGKA